MLRWLVKGDIRSGRFCVDFPERGFEIWTYQICIFFTKTVKGPSSGLLEQANDHKREKTTPIPQLLFVLDKKLSVNPIRTGGGGYLVFVQIHIRAC